MRKRKHIVLIGSAGTATSFAAIKALRKNFNAIIVSIDINPQHLVTASLLSDYFVKVPPIADEKFNVIIGEIINNYSVDTYIPIIDLEIFKCAKIFQEINNSNNIFLQVKDPEIAEICLDKYLTYTWLTKKGYPTPKTILIDKKTLENINNEQLIVKPKRGYGSKSVRRIYKDEAKLYLNDENYILQEVCETPEITVDVCYSKKYESFHFACRERIEVKSGVCTKTRIFFDKTLKDLAYSLANDLNLLSFCFQVMMQNGSFVITDINARLGAGTALSVAAGLDFFSGMFSALWGENPSKYFRRDFNEKFVTRQYSEYVM
ncbi:MAG: ATP-grasp domain-containing protein [Bacteroidales bacterium]